MKLAMHRPKIDLKEAARSREDNMRGLQVLRGLAPDDWMENEYGDTCASGEVAPSHASAGEVLSNSSRIRRRRTSERSQHQRSPHQSADDHSYTTPVTSGASGGIGPGPRANASPSSATTAGGGVGGGPGAGAGPVSSSLASRGSPPGLDSSSSTNASTPEDEFDAFGRSAAAQLRRMPLRMALRAQLQIQSFLTEARLYACSGYEDFPEDS